MTGHGKTASMPVLDTLELSLQVCLSRWDADAARIADRQLPRFADATVLTVADRAESGREFLLTPATATAWQQMKNAAAKDQVELLMVSAFRSFNRQAELIETKLAAGQDVDQILTLLAPPGCSEHHSGRAVDIGCPQARPLDETFEHTTAFAWLQTHAPDHGFVLSYPRGNRYGYIYEPWHWCYQGAAA